MDRSYHRRFLKHFQDTVEKFKLFDSTNHLMVAVSGGLDSVALLYILHELSEMYQGLRAIHINHQTRDGQAEEAIFVKNLCQKLGIECVIKHVSALGQSKSLVNFEHRAREERYKLFYEELKEGELLLLAHHIDDSFEWSLLQSLRSSNLLPSLGIPIVNGQLRRPLMGFSRRQLEAFCKNAALNYRDDPTNRDDSYERNFLRLHVLPLFRKRHPQFLFHYSVRQNELARKLGKHAIYKRNSSFESVYSSQAVGIFQKMGDDEFSGIEDEVRKAISLLLPGSRGSLSRQLQRVVIAMKKGKLGPLTMTKGVKIYLGKNHLLVAKKEFHCIGEKGIIWTEERSFSLEELESYVREWVQDPLALNLYPFWVRLKRSSFFSPQRRIHPFWNRPILDKNERTTIYMGALDLLTQWKALKKKPSKLWIAFYKQSF